MTAEATTYDKKFNAQRGAQRAAGLAAVGTLFAAMTAHLRARELLFPVLFLPMEVPVLLGTVQATEALFLGEPLSAVSHWLKLLLAADLIYLTAGILTFDFILEG